MFIYIIRLHIGITILQNSTFLFQIVHNLTVFSGVTYVWFIWIGVHLDFKCNDQCNKCDPFHVINVLTIRVAVPT